MRRLEHALIGAGCGAAVAHVAGLDVGWSMLIAAVGASVPDVDLKWADRWHRPAPGSCCRLLDHRGPTHSVTLALMAGIAVGAGVGWWIGLLFAAGWLSHLAADAWSPMGEPFLWPLSARRFRLMPRGLRVRSGTWWIELPVALLVLGVGLRVG